jgi:hypothetical protein
MEDPDGKYHATPQQRFEGNVWTMKAGSDPQRAHALFLHGMEKAITQTVLDRIEELRQEGFF